MCVYRLDSVDRNDPGHLLLAEGRERACDSPFSQLFIRVIFPDPNRTSSIIVTPSGISVPR